MRDLMLQFSNNIFIEILMLADLLIHVNLMAFVPEEYVHYLGVQKLGMCEFFCLLFTACECLSVLKNMVLCGLPVPKKVENWLRDFLANMTAELTMDNGINDKVSEIGEADIKEANTNNGVLNEMTEGGAEHVRQ